MANVPDPTDLIFKPQPPDLRRTWRRFGLCVIPYAAMPVALWRSDGQGFMYALGQRVRWAEDATSLRLPPPPL